MPQFSQRSLVALRTCHPLLQELLNEAIKHVDFVVLEGHRGEEAQELAFSRGESYKHWPEGKHNSIPSMAADLAPWPIDWKDHPRFIRVLSIIQGIAMARGLKVRLGLDWNNDFRFNEEFKDYPHIELLEGSLRYPAP